MSGSHWPICLALQLHACSFLYLYPALEYHLCLIAKDLAMDLSIALGERECLRYGDTVQNLMF